MKQVVLLCLLLVFTIGAISTLSAQVNVTIGSGTNSNTTTSTPTPYGTYYKNFRQQYLFLASEIEDAGGGGGAINSLAFNVEALNECSPMPDFRISLKHTTQVELTTTFETGDYTQVFLENDFVPTTGWNTHTFDTPFVWDGSSNLIVEVLTDLIPGNYTQNASVYYTPTTFNSALRYQSDSTPASNSTTGSLSMNRNNIRFNMQELIVDDPPNAAQIISPANGATLVSPYVSFFWASGGGAPAGYKFNLGTNNPPTNIVSNQDMEDETSFSTDTPLNIDTTYYWQVVPYNAIGDAVNCPVWSFTTHGDATIDALPYFQDWDSVTAPELPFDWSSIVEANNTTAVVETNLSSPHSAPNNIRLLNGADANAEIILISPELDASIPMNTVRVKAWVRPVSNTYTLELGVMTNPTDASTFQNVQTLTFENTNYAEHAVPLTSYTGAGRFIAFRHGLGGTTRTIYIDDVTFEEIAPDDLAAISVSGNTTPSVGAPFQYSVEVFNNGTSAQDNYQVKLMSGTTELGSVAGPAIDPGESLSVPISWTPDAEGPTTIFGKVILVGDVNPQNDETPPLNISVQSEGVYSVTIGDGDQTQRVPFDFYYRNSLFQTLYYQAEMGMFGTITALTFYNSFSTDLPAMPIKIWLGTTTDDDLSAGWHDPGSMTLVYDGTVDFPSGENTITIPLQAPYTYVGGNLVLYANRTWDPSWYSSMDNFIAQTVGTNRARKVISDSVEYDPMDPSAAGTLSGTFPKTTFMMSPISDDPTFIVMPNEYDFGTVLLQSTSQKSFMITNAGGGNLGVSSISIAGNDSFTLSNLPDLPASLTTGQVLNFHVIYTPETVGEHSATVTIVDDVTRETHTIEITGDGFDATIYALPATEDWDDANVPRFPLGWHSILNSTSTSAYLQTTTSLPYSDPNCVQMANSNDATALMILVSPPFDSEIEMSSVRVRIMAKGSTALYPLQIGTMSDSSDPTTFEMAEELSITANWNEYQVNLTGHDPAGQYIAIKHGSSSTYQTIYIDDVTFEPIAPNDLAVIALSGNSTPSVNMETTYTATILNNGTAMQDDYLVKLYDSEDTELASVAGPAIDANETELVELLWTPTVEGPASLYAKVILDGDINPNNDVSNPLNISVQPEGVISVTIGEGNETARVPFDMFYRHSLYQCLYYPYEINMVGVITTLSLYNDFSTNLPNMPIKLWLGTTDLEDLSAGWADPTALTMVYDGTIDFPTGQNTITIPLQVPYSYTGGNLVLYAMRPMDTGYYSSADTFQAQTVGSNRARNIYTDSTTYDPMAPSATGSLTGTFPKVTFTLTPLTGDPVFSVYPASWDFGDVNIGGTRNKSFRIMNVGGGTLGVNEISISGSGTMTLTDLPDLPASMDTGDFVTFNVSFSPTMLSEEEATVTITDDIGERHVFSFGTQDRAGIASRSANTRNRETHTIELSGAGVNDITIGSGTMTDRVPMDFFWRNSLFETVFSVDEMSGFVGMITGVKFYNSFSSNLTAMPTKIWLGSTTQTNLSQGWIPATDLTLVFDGSVDYPSGQNIISIDFPEYYMHLDGGNLVMMVNRPMDTSYYSSSDYFYADTAGSDRSLRMQSDSTIYDPDNPTGGTLSGIFPITTFMVIPGGVGHITGTVTGADDAPLPGVEVSVGQRYNTLTDDNGEYYIANVLPGDYTVSFSRYTYISQSVDITLEEDETEIVDVNMQLMPQVTVSGRILASDTGAGIAGANIHLTGYADYSITSTADGSFSNDLVFAGHIYAYTISAAGYTSTTGSITVVDADYDMGDIVLSEIAYAPNSVEAVINDSFDAINLSWNAPDPNAIEITESFEAASFPPQDWDQVITNTGAANPLGVLPTWCSFGSITITGTGTVAPTDGVKQAGLWWDYTHQSEWLLTPSFNCPPDAFMSFDTYLEMGSPNGDHYYVKASTDGGVSWQNLWDGAAQNQGVNNYDVPITVGLEQFGGQQIQLAFHAEDPPSNDGLWYTWFIDNVYIGNFVNQLDFSPVNASLIPRSLEDVNARRGHDTPSMLNRDGSHSRFSSPSLRENRRNDRSIVSNPQTRAHDRALLGYRVWRLVSGQENNESNWTEITDEVISNLNITDEGWNTLPNATYKWAVKAVYTAGVESVPAFSNPMVNETVTGNIVGFVRRNNGQGIANATVTAGENFTATTNSAGAYSLNLPAGVYSVTASAASFASHTVEDVTVAPNQNTTLNFTLETASNEDEVIPVTVTALHGNYPNPFNPETTISYDIKDPTNVRLDIYNVRGQLVRTLVNEQQSSARYRVVFDAKDRNGSPLSSGIYFYRLRAGDYIQTRKMMLME